MPSSRRTSRVWPLRIPSGRFPLEQEVDLETPLPDLGVDLADHQAVRLFAAVEAAPLPPAYAADVMLVDGGPHLEALGHVDLSKPRPRPLALSDLGVQRGQLPGDGGPHRQVVQPPPDDFGDRAPVRSTAETSCATLLAASSESWV